ncbi:phage major capsid protein [Bifidobacterium mongoliense]|uniref:Phage head n=1 Tax=Bifidobacterium mongoliense TaxID=518643 RepID=A0A423UD31_9BIFI|nr:phage major capsid protein [Bifidobacterium mongoliense]ROT86583.1 phage head [Bifidobacterium mongoliense]
MNLREKRAALLAKAQQYQKKINDGTVTDEDVASLKGILADIKAVDVQLAKAAEKKPLLDALGSLGGNGATALGHDAPLAGGAKYGASMRLKSVDLSASMIRSVKSASADGLTVSGSSVTDIPLVSADPLVLPQAPTSFLEALSFTRRANPSWSYLRQTVGVVNAAFVPAGQAKPESDLEIERVEGKLQVLATLSKPVDKYMLGDNTNLSQFVSGQLSLGLQRHLESEVLTGDGTEYKANSSTYHHLKGLLKTDGIQQLKADSADRALTLRKAIDLLEDVGHVCSMFVLNPADWSGIETQRNTSGTFDLGTVAARASKTLWGVPVVTSAGVASGTAIALDASAFSVDTDGRVNLEWDASGDLFTHNQLRARCEGRFGLSVYRPAGIVKANLVKAVV